MKLTLRHAVLLAFGLAFISVWLPKAFPSQATVSLFWPVYHWYGIDYYFRFVDTPGILVGSILLGLSTILARDYLENSNKVGKIPVRIHVTGTRGKSTTTRLIGAALRKAGLRAITKTTGKDARLTDEKGVEHRIRDHNALPNLREQARIVSDIIANGGADAIVFECMSIRPRNIEAESRYLCPTISVITNIRADHLDVMGPTLEDVAWTLSGVIPSSGTLVTAEKRYLPVIMKRALDKGANVVEVDESVIPDDLVSRFPYLIFKENIAIALAVCKLVGISQRDAIDGMLQAKPDPGLTRVMEATIAGHRVKFIAAFGVNDVDSTRIAYLEMKRRGIIQGGGLVGLFHGRDDRITRTLEFAEFMARMPFEEIICVGKTTSLFAGVASRAGYPKGRIVDLGQAKEDDILRHLEAAVQRREGQVVLFGCGNMIGIEGFLRRFEGLSVRGSEIEAAGEPI